MEKADQDIIDLATRIMVHANERRIAAIYVDIRYKETPVILAQVTICGNTEDQDKIMQSIHPRTHPV